MPIKNRFRRRAAPYLFVLPALLLTVGILYPFLLSAYYSLTNYRLGSSAVQFVGLRNYRDLISDGAFWQSLGLTVGYTVAAVLIQLSLGLGGALLLNNDLKGVSLARSLIILPLMMPPVVAALMWKVIMAPNGILNYLLGLSQVSWLGTKTTALVSILIIDTWIYTPFATVLFLAGLRSLPQEPYEAARLDGGSSLFIFRQLTLPLLRPFIVIVALFRTIDSLKTFDIIYATTKGGPGNSSMLLQVKAYFQAFRHYQLGSALACMMILWLIIFFLSQVLVKLWNFAMRQVSGR
jgi:multiple sugar transport system permease protein